MEIKDFVKEAITEIVSCVNEANEEIKASEAYIAFCGVRHCGEGSFELVEDDSWGLRPISNVDFDIAVTTSDSTEKSGKGGITVLNVAKFGGGLTNQSVQGITNRLKFSIPLVLPPNIKQE